MRAEHASSLSVVKLVKDVPGYFSADPNIYPDAQPLEHITFEGAIEMARDGCELVQPAALEAARDHDLTLLVRAIEERTGTIVRSKE